MSEWGVGCHTCKIRKVKCDKGRPSCLRCMKSKRVCLRTGSQQPVFSIHSENRYASGQTKRPRGPRSSVNLNLAGRAANRPILLQPQQDLETRALAYYFHVQLQTLTNVSGACNGLTDLLPMWASKSSGGVVRLGIKTLALATYAQIHGDPVAATAAAKKYQRLLCDMRQVIPRVDTATLDACLLAIFTMCRYEGAMYSPNGGDVIDDQRLAHYLGATAVLKLWKETLSYRMPATEIIKHSRRGLLRNLLLRGWKVPRWIKKGHEFGERGHDLAFDSIMVRLLDVRQAAFALSAQSPEIIISTSTTVSQKAVELYDEILEIDSALQDWKGHLPKTWASRTSHTDAGACQQHGESPLPWTIYSYPSLAHAWTWNQYITTSLLIDSTRLRLLDLCRARVDVGFLESERKQASSRMFTMADQLAANIPYCLSRFKVTDTSPDSGSGADHAWCTSTKNIDPYAAVQLVFPLSIAGGITNLESRQRAWFRSMLAALGRIIGIGVIAFADEDRWISL